MQSPWARAYNGGLRAKVLVNSATHEVGNDVRKHACETAKGLKVDAKRQVTKQSCPDGGQKVQENSGLTDLSGFWHRIVIN